MDAITDGALILRAIVAIVGTDCSVWYVILETYSRSVARVWCRTVIVCRVAAGSSGRQRRVRAGTFLTEVIRAIITVVGTVRPVSHMIRLANPRSVAGIRRRAITGRWITTRRSGGQVRMGTDTGQASIVSTVVTVVATARPVSHVIGLTDPRFVAGIRRRAVTGRWITTRRSGGQVRVGAETRHADIHGAVVAVVGTGRAVRCVVGPAYAQSVASVGIRAIIVRGIATGGSGGKAGVGAHPGRTNVVRTIVAVVRATRSIGLMVGQARPGSVAGIRIRAVVVCRIATQSSGGKGRVKADSGDANVAGTIVGVIRTACSVGLVVGHARARSVAGIRVGAVVVGGVATGGAGRMIRMRTDAVATDVVRATVSVIRAARSVGETRVYT